jgi:hypothetical protein
MSSRSRTFALVASLFASTWGAPLVAAAGQISALRIIVLEGEDAVNIINQKTAVAPTVEVRDRNDLPVAGAVVLFALRGRGGASFANGARQVSLTTNSLGRATVSELTPIGKGTVEIQVSASFQGQTATATIHQTNFATATEAAKAGKMPTQAGQSATTGTTSTTTAAGGAAGGGLSGLAIAGIIGGAAAGTAIGVAAARGGNKAPANSTVPANPPSTGSALLELTYSPDPAPRVVGTCPWIVRVTLREAAGVGFTIGVWQERFFLGDGSLAGEITFPQTSVVSRLGSNHVAAFGSVTYGSEPCQSDFAMMETTFSGTDDNRNAVSVVKRLRLLP